MPPQIRVQILDMTKPFFLAGSVLAALALATPASAQVPLQSQPPQITVEGRAQELVEPDALRIVVGVETHGASHVEAMAENAKVAARVIDAAKQRGVAPAEIRTGRIDLRPDTSSSAARSGPYRAVNLVAVTMRNVAEADQLVAALITAGANRVHGIAPIVERSAERAARLREKAIANAREVAEQSVKAASARLGPILTIRATTEDTTGGAVAYRAVPTAGVPIEEGTVPVSVNVTMTWAIVQ